jgi:hypothetical protein
MSRYSDFDGYWLFGKLVNDLDQLQINLLEASQNSTTAIDRARSLAQAKFADQIQKARKQLTDFQQAFLRITRTHELSPGRVNAVTCSKMPPSITDGGNSSGWTEFTRDGYIVTFNASVVTRTNRHICVERSVFVAPHDPNYEQRYPLIEEC